MDHPDAEASNVKRHVEGLNQVGCMSIEAAQGPKKPI
jgi:hypothetical protein